MIPAIITLVLGIAMFILDVNPIIEFIIGLACLIFGGDKFVDGAVGIAEKLKLPEILIGATIVSIGTTLPEVMVSASAAATGHGQIAYGNAIGSIICNTALICAITMAIKPCKAEKNGLKIPVCFFGGAIILYLVFSYVFKEFTRLFGIILLLVFVVYMIISVLQSVKASKESAETELPAEDEPKKQKSLLVYIIFLIVGAANIALGADLLVDNGTLIAEALGVPESVIALTFVALGTSLPELVTAITSLVKGHGAVSLGNIIGANMFNIILVSGLAITINPFNVPASKLIAGMNASLVIDLPLMVLVSLILLIPALIKGKVFRWQGIVLLLLYAGYCYFQFAM